MAKPHGSLAGARALGIAQGGDADRFADAVLVKQDGSLLVSRALCVAEWGNADRFADLVFNLV
ncbi:hypothetical protein, partial [Klebsiella pneumoniae]|uniref:hypothetical protein n=1 Tax=Klebsiella pneumoniae TaxID=573 RepID=UPI0039C3A4C2